MSNEKVIEVAIKQNIRKFSITGTEIEINVYFNLNSLREFFENYDMFKDYKKAFSHAVFFMYQETERYSTDEVLSEEDFISVTDDDLIAVLNHIMKNDDRLRSEFDKIEHENVFERFYVANDNLIKATTKPISDAFKHLTNIYRPHILGVASVLTKQNTIRFNVPHIKALNEMTSRLEMQAQLVAERLRIFDYSSKVNLTKFEFPHMQSMLDNIPKFNINITEIIQPFTKQVSMWESSIRQLNNTLLSFTESFAKIDFSMLTYHLEWSEKHDFLVGNGWFYLNELPKEIIVTIYERRHNITSFEVDEIITHHFRQNRCSELKRIVQKWNSSTYFESRKRIFYEALVNHSRRYYNSSTTLLVIHTEGIITDFARLKLQMPRYKARKAISDITDCLVDMPMKTLSLSDWEIFNCVFERILDSFQEGFSHSNPNNASNSSRDKIAHGHVVERETEVSSLKQFLYLNEVYRLFTLFDEKFFSKT